MHLILFFTDVFVFFKHYLCFTNKSVRCKKIKSKFKDMFSNSFRQLISDFNNGNRTISYNFERRYLQLFGTADGSGNG